MRRPTRGELVDIDTAVFELSLDDEVVAHLITEVFWSDFWCELVLRRRRACVLCKVVWLDGLRSYPETGIPDSALLDELHRGVFTLDTGEGHRRFTARRLTGSSAEAALQAYDD